MKLVQKENRQLRIEDCRLPEFLAKGYAEVTQAKTERPQDIPCLCSNEKISVCLSSNSLRIYRFSRQPKTAGKIIAAG